MKKNKEKNGTITGIVSGLTSGAYLGSGIGIAAGPLGAISGLIPGAIIGGIVGGLAGNRIGLELDREKNTEKSKAFNEKVEKRVEEYKMRRMSALERIEFAKKNKESEKDRIASCLNRLFNHNLWDEPEGEIDSLLISARKQDDLFNRKGLTEKYVLTGMI